MAEQVTRIEIDIIKEDINKIECKVQQQESETKTQFKEQAIVIQGIRDSGFKMEFLVNHIIQSQTDMVEQAKTDAKANKEAQSVLLDNVTALQNAPFLAWKKMHWLIKSTLVTLFTTLIGTYFYMSFQTYIKMKAGGM